ncbi:MAG: hypothetical protein ACXVH3_35740, partial [Solirubrobacteraceae bacterium]
IFEKMKRRLEESLKRDPRDMYVVYAFPESREVFDDSPVFETISSRKRYVVYRSKPTLETVRSQLTNPSPPPN